MIESVEPITQADAKAPAGVASQRIAEYVRERILSGALPPGTRIRQEEIAREFGASRLPVREALRILASQGLVTLKAHSGAWVSQMDADECDLAYKIRERLEPLALAESIPHLTSEVIDRLDEIQDEIEADHNLDRFMQLDRELHLLSYSGNPYRELREMVERLWNVTQPYRRAYVEQAGHERDWVIDAEHRLLIDAIRRSDIVDAERILAGHIRRTRIALVPVIRKNSG